jgi:hypothetical protein
VSGFHLASPRFITHVSKSGSHAACSQSSFLGNLWSCAALQGDQADAADAVQLQQQLAEAQGQAQAATTEAATLQRQLDSQQVAAAAMQRQQEAAAA